MSFMKRRQFQLASAGSLFILGLMMSGCSQPSGSTSSSATSGSSGGSQTFALIPMSTTDEYWKAVHAGALQAVADLKLPSDCLKFVGPSNPDDPQSEGQTVESMVGSGVKGIELAPADPQALMPSVQGAKAKGVPVVVIDSPLNGHDYDSFVGTDNKQAGVQAADELAKLIGGKGAVLMVRMKEGQASTEARGDGFYQEMTSKYPQIKIIGNHDYAGVVTDQAMKKSESMLQSIRNPDGSLQVQGIFAVNEPTTLGMLKALQSGGYVGKAKFVGFDSSEPLNAALAQGQIDALVVQDPFTIGYKGFMHMYDLANKKTAPPVLYTPATVITSKDCNTPENQKLLNPKRL